MTHFHSYKLSCKKDPLQNKSSNLHFPRLCVFSLCVTQQLPSLSAGIFWPNKMRHQNGGRIHLCRRHFTFFLLFKGTAPICFIIMLCSYPPVLDALSPLLSTLPATNKLKIILIIINASCVCQDVEFPVWLIININL